jgi:hypothetical protein
MASPLCPAPTTTVVVYRIAVPDQETVTETAVGLVRMS